MEKWQICGIAFGKFGETVTGYGKLSEVLKAGASTEPVTFVQSLGKMFSVDKLKADATLVTDTMAQWKEFWILPAIMAAVIMVVFFLGFWEKNSSNSDSSK